MTPTKTEKTEKTDMTNPAAEAAALAAEAAQAAERAAEAQSRAEAAAQRAEERRQAEIAAIRRRRLEAYDEAALTAETKAAADLFRLAIEDGMPGILEFVGWQEISTRRYLLATEASTIQHSIDPNAPAIPTGGPAGADYAVEVQRIATAMLGNRTADFEGARQAEIDEAGL